MIPGLSVPNIGVGVGLVRPVSSPEMIAGAVTGLLGNPKRIRNKLQHVDGDDIDGHVYLPPLVPAPWAEL